jgi:transcription elongation factor Elf1
MRCDFCNNKAIGKIKKGASKGTKYCEDCESHILEFLSDEYLEEFK